jgi:hypothetical protein
MGGGGGGVASFRAVHARAWTGGDFVQGLSMAPDKKIVVFMRDVYTGTQKGRIEPA